jgi:transcriptional regulator with XRE-family HTH domain
MSEKLLMILEVSERGTEGVGARLKRLRIERRLSQRDLSSPGVSYAYISRIEAGARTPSVKALRKLAQKLGVSVEYLETGRDIREVDDRELRLADAELQVRLDADTQAAEQKLSEVFEEARAAGDRVSASRAAIGLGLAAAYRGNHLDAVERLESALQFERVSPVVRSDVYSTLAQSYAALGAADRAVKILGDCLAEVKSAAPGNVTLQVQYASYLSYAYSDAGQHDRAAEVIRDALKLAGDSADGYTRVRLLWGLARVAAIEGRGSEALIHIRRAIALLETTDDTLQLARGYLLSAGIESIEGNIEGTREHLEVARQLLGPSPEAIDRGMILIGRSRVARLEHDADRAVEYARDAIATLGDFNAAELGSACWALAGGLALQRDVQGANDAYRRAVDLLTVHGRRHNAGLASLEWAELLKENGREAEAEPILRRAYDLGVTAETASRTS